VEEEEAAKEKLEVGTGSLEFRCQSKVERERDSRKQVGGM